MVNHLIIFLIYQGENLAEMWVNYLIKQAEDDNKGKSNTQQAVTASKSPEGLK
jgi:Ca2+-binding EF-hand superfamily protein